MVARGIGRTAAGEVQRASALVTVDLIGLPILFSTRNAGRQSNAPGAGSHARGVACWSQAPWFKGLSLGLRTKTVVNDSRHSVCRPGNLCAVRPDVAELGLLLIPSHHRLITAKLVVRFKTLFWKIALNRPYSSASLALVSVGKNQAEAKLHFWRAQVQLRSLLFIGS